MLLRKDFILNFQWIRCWKMTVLYLYLMVWGVTNWAFWVWGSNCTNCVDFRHFWCFSAQLSPPASIFFKSLDWNLNISSLTNQHDISMLDFFIFLEYFHHPGAFHLRKGHKFTLNCKEPYSALWGSCNGKLEIGFFHFWERNISGIFGHG